jgi:hypothetical protein
MEKLTAGRDMVVDKMIILKCILNKQVLWREMNSLDSK